jgi:hypothetical protein
MDPELKRRFDQLLLDLGDKKLTPAMESLLRWLLDQDSLLQSMLLGGIQPKDYPEVADLVLKRLARRRGAAARPADVGRVGAEGEAEELPAGEAPPPASRHGRRRG